MWYWLYRIQGEEVVSAASIEAPDDASARGLVDRADLTDADSVEVWNREALVHAKRKTMN